MTAGHVLGRSIDNVLANWEALLLAVGVSVVAAIASFGVAMAAGMPVLVSMSNAARTDRLGMLFFLGVIVAAGAVWSVMMAFPSAACARIYIDGHRAAAATPERTRAAYRAFSLPAWLAAGKALWLRVFVVELFAVAAVVLVVCLPMLIILLLPKECAGCFGCVVMVPVMLVAAVIGTIWPTKAIILAVDGAAWEDALTDAWNAILGRLGEHFVPLLIIGVATSFASSVLATLATAAGGCWALAAMVVLTEERR